jgi:MazG family protein
MNDTPDPAPGHDHATTSEGRLDRALALVRFLRSACPWDAAQTHASLVPHLLEEAAETADAIHDEDDDALEDELGDLLLNLAFQVVVAEERGAMDAESITRRLERKMRRRHPHLYGDGPKERWEAIKARERAGTSDERAEKGGVLSGISPGLDPLTAAYRIQDRVAGVGFDWEDARGALVKAREEVDEVEEELARSRPSGARTEDAPRDPPPALVEEVGDLLFAVVNVARLAGVHPTTALAAANRKFTRRFESLEAMASAEGVEFGEASLEELDALWERVKAGE